MDLSGVVFNTSDALNVVVLVLGASAILWGARAALHFVRH